MKKSLVTILYVLLLTSICLAEGINDGRHVDYYDNGNIRQESTYKDQKLMQFKTYHKNGNLEREDNFLYGVRHGLSITKDIDGNIKGKQLYNDGRLIESQWFDKEGNTTTFLEKNIKHPDEINAEYILKVGVAGWPAIFEDDNLPKELENNIIEDINNVHAQLNNYAVIKHVKSSGNVIVGDKKFDFVGYIHLGDDPNYSLRPDIFWRQNLMQLIVKDEYDTIVIPKTISDEYKRMLSFWNTHSKEREGLDEFISSFNDSHDANDLTADKKENLFYLQLGRSEYSPDKFADIQKGYVGLTGELLKNKIAYHSIIHKCSYYEELIKESFKSNPEGAERFLSIPGADQISLICEIPFVDRSSETFTSSALPVVYANDAWHFYITDMGE